MARPPAKQVTSKNSRNNTFNPEDKKKRNYQPGSDENQLIIDIAHAGSHSSSVLSLVKRKLQHAVAAPMPADLKPMLATLVDEPFSDEAWQFELKLDGYRTLAYMNKGQVSLRSRNNNSFDEKFSPIRDELKKWKINAVIDGEIVVLNQEGHPDFNAIQQWDKEKKGWLVFYAFDILWLDGYNVMEEPLFVRRAILKQLIPASGSIRFSDHIDGAGQDLFELIRKNGLEGIIAKKKNEIYIPGARSKTWLKIKAEQRHEAVICGFTKKKASSKLFSSLVLGKIANGKLIYIGQAGTGFTNDMQKELLRQFKALVVKNCPFKELPDVADPVKWLIPELVCEVKYTELTKEGVMRHPSFQGLRPDKTVDDFNLDEVQESSELVAQHKNGDTADEQLITLNQHELKLTNLNKIYWPREGISKGDLIRYYMEIAPFMLPYMKDRPQSLNRFPNGIEGKSFYQKNMAGKTEKWMKTFKRFSESSGDPKDFMICTDEASLIYMANLGCIEMNPWHSRVQNALCPDWCVIDLDPGEISFLKVVEAAQVVKQVLDTLQIPSFPKTSGSTGLHIYIPLGGKYNYDQSRQLAELIATMVHQEIPGFTSLVRNPAKRKTLIYIDYLQNRPIQTICAPYSARPKPGATVSAPLHWDEVKKGLSLQQFHIKNMAARIKAEGDLFKGVLGKGIDLNNVIKGISALI